MRYSWPSSIPNKGSPQTIELKTPDTVPSPQHMFIRYSAFFPASSFFLSLLFCSFFLFCLRYRLTWVYKSCILAHSRRALFLKFYYLYAYVCAWVSSCVLCRDFQKPKEAARSHGIWVTGIVAAMRTLGIKSRSSARVRNAHNHWAISPSALDLYFWQNLVFFLL